MSKPKLIISTTGTSIGLNVRRDIFPKTFNEENRRSIKEEITKSIYNKECNVISAETKSLHKIGIDDSTHIAFIHTDTDDGELCAQVLNEWCTSHWGCHVSLFRVKGLQVKDAEVFARVGIKEYLRICIDLIEKYCFSHDVILNPTGGFKGIVPYTTLVGMIFSRPIYYIFEWSDALIRLPSIPISYDEELMDRCAQRLKQIEDETAIEADAFWQGIDFHERGKFLSLIEEENGDVTLSPVGMLLWERYKKDFPVHLRRSQIEPENKKINLRDDHGIDILKHWAKRLVNNPYVEKIVNSLPFNPRTTNPIKKVHDNGLVELVLTKTDAGYGMVVMTTGTNKKETEEIAGILLSRYGL